MYKLQGVFLMNRILKVSFMILLVFMLISCGDRNPEKTDKLRVSVSILPQKYFVEKIGGSRVNVSVMVEPGQSPETYEPAPARMAAVHDSRILFVLGVPFEEAWVGRIRAQNRDLVISDTSSGIERREMESPALILGEEEHHHGHHGTRDPHLWLDPVRVIKMADNIYNELVKADPQGMKEYRKGRDLFIKELSELDKMIVEILRPLHGSEIFVFHPAWGYFTDRYGLKQFPVEIEGREPGPREFARIMDAAQGKHIRAIFVQKQFSTHTAQAIGRQLGADVITVDPLAEDYRANLESLARIIAGEKR